MFVRGAERWTATVAGNLIPLHYDPVTQTISATALDRDNVYFVSPGKYKRAMKGHIFIMQCQIRVIKGAEFFVKYIQA